MPLLSYIVLGGKCRDCGERISWRYPVIEGLVGVLFAVAGGVFFSPVDAMSWIRVADILGVVAFAVVIAAYDARYKEIPMLVLWLAIVWSGVFALWKDALLEMTHLAGVFDLSLYSGVFAGLVGFLFFFLLSAVSRERWMGLGDAYVVFWMGLVLGWPNLLPALLFAFASGAVWGLSMIVLGKSSLKSQLPFAPFLLAGMLITLLFGEGVSFLRFVW